MRHRRLAALMLAQGWEPGPMAAALAAVWQGDGDHPSDIVEEIRAAWPLPYAPAEDWLAAELARFDLSAYDPPVITAPPACRPLAPFRGLGLPALPSPGALAAWLEIPGPQLDWFADCDARLARPAAARFGHYVQHWQPKRGGGQRLVEAPRPRLKALQRRVLRGIVDLVPAHPAACGFVKGRDCRAHAARHAGENLVIALDLKDFFASAPARRVHGIFRCLGYPPAVARLLTGLVTVATPADCVAVLPPADRPAFRAPHLPQGAPTSPALANLAAWPMDRRLAALARRAGVAYSRYADDLAFSGDRDVGVSGLLSAVGEIARGSGFRLNPAKTRVMRQGGRQRLTGIVVNRRINSPRAETDRLKAILTNCLRHGPAGQNRAGHPDFRAHLSGRIAWVEAVNPARAAKLRAIFERIRWPA